MTENNESENRRIDIEEGNYNERIEGNYVQGRNNFLNNTFAIFARQGSSEALSSAKHSRIRQVLLKQVNDEVEIRINSSLHNRVYIVLDAEQNPEQIELPWSSEIKVASQPKIRLDNTDIINVFDQPDVAGRLLILGQPGSGKTTMLLKLADELVKRAKDNSTNPVPVLFTLSSWTNDNQSIKDWLVEQLKDKYGLQKDIGKLWINNQELIPFLDGLDELVAERQEKCVLKINEFLHPSNWTNAVVVCSRIQEYQRYSSLLQLNSSLELYPFSQEQVYQYLQSTDNLQLWDSISHDADLSQLAKTPLLLNIIVLSAQEISIQTWQQFKSSEERLSYLFDAYIRRMFKRAYKYKQPHLENTQRWLNWLAHRLIEESATEFLIEKMQPDWLKDKVPKIIYNLIVWGVIGALIQGLISGMSSGLINGKLQILGLISGVISGVIYGLIYGLIGDSIENNIKKRIVLINPLKKISETIISGLIIGLIVGLIYGLIYGLIFNLVPGLYSELNFGLNFGLNSDQKNMLIKEMTSGNVKSYGLWLVSGLYAGLIYGLIYGLIGNKIRTVETLIFSLKKVLNGLKNGLIWGAISGGIMAEFSGIIGAFIGIIGAFYKAFPLHKNDLFLLVISAIIVPIGVIIVEIFGALFGALCGLFLAAFFGMFYGINGVEIENKKIPNQGIRQSVINTIKISLLFSLFISLIIFMVQIIIKYKINNQVSINWLSDGIFLGILIGISRSGIPAIKHFILRVILWSNGYAPWNYAKFLNYCTNRLFLQRVGGGYRFIHDLLRQHFAKSYTQISLVPIQEILVQPSPPQVQNYHRCTNCGHNNLANLNFCTKCGTKLNQPHI